MSRCKANSPASTSRCVAGQTKAIGELAQKTATEPLEPIKEQVAKSFKIAL